MKANNPVTACATSKERTEISEKSPAGIDVKWLMGEDEPETKRHKAFVNPLKGVSCEDCWENIWMD